MSQPIALQRSSRICASNAALRTDQNGSVLIQFAVFLFIIVAILGVADLGYSFYAKRDLQRIADLAAIEAVQGIDFQTPNNSAPCKAAGDRSVENNWPSPLNAITKTVVCGEWDAGKYASPRYFQGEAKPLNAAHVVLEGETPSFFPARWDRNVRAEAIAQRSAPSAAFQVGSQLLNLNNDAPLGRLLTLMGLDPEKLTVLDANGLANAKISPSGLLKTLGVDLGINGLSALTPQQLADLNNLTLLQIMDASLELVSDDTLKADIDAAIAVLRDLKIGSVRLLDMKIPLLRDSSSSDSGIFTFLSLGRSDSPDGAALNSQIGVGDLLKTAIMIAAKDNAIKISGASLTDAVQLGLTVVEAPTIAGGPIGTKANNAQVRAELDIDSSKIPLLGSLFESLLGGLRINLPVKIQGVSADATLTDVYCPDPDRGNQPSIDLGVKSRVAKVVIGDESASASDPKNLLIKTPISGINVRGPITTDVLAAREETVNLVVGQVDWTKENTLLLGDTVGSLTDALFSLLGGIFSPPRWRPTGKA
ncbi:TadG family pilus assembly protein [Ottowia sp. VDI28]|uniref:TadG family pilus assembly protein n=1 Tax=Ottowia sp. VDI28 TaxID=3133968 RepID=UPI003C302C1F